MNLFGKKKGNIGASQLLAMLQQGNSQGDEDYGPTLEQLAATRAPQENPYANLQQQTGQQQAPNFQEYMKGVLGPKPQGQPPPQGPEQQYKTQGGGWNPSMGSGPQILPEQETQAFLQGVKESPAGQGFAYYGDLAKRLAMFPGKLSHELGVNQAVENEARRTFGFDPAEQPKPQVNANVPPTVKKSGQEDQPTQEERLPDASPEDNAKNVDMMLGGGLFKGAMEATTDILSKYGKMAQSMQGAKDALRREFEGTPELDAIISKTEMELSDLKGKRKQPGIGDFLVLALMNLGNPGNMRNNADMVLGTGKQERDEMRLEDRLAQLEGGRASAKMHGRQAMRGMEQQEKYQALQRMMQQQEQGRKQANEDRDFGFKKEKLGSDKLMQELGQLRQMLQFETDPGKRKALNAEVDRLDPYGRLRQALPPQKLQPTKDTRQSRMFGDMVGGGGYA